MKRPLKNRANKSAAIMFILIFAYQRLSMTRSEPWTIKLPSQGL